MMLGGLVPRESQTKGLLAGFGPVAPQSHLTMDDTGVGLMT